MVLWLYMLVYVVAQMLYAFPILDEVLCFLTVHLENHAFQLKITGKKHLFVFVKKPGNTKFHLRGNPVYILAELSKD